jgi:hypothetical protein
VFRGVLLRRACCMWLLRSAHVALFPLDDTSERLSCVARVSENAKRGSAGATNVSESTMQEECSSTSPLRLVGGRMLFTRRPCCFARHHCAAGSS